MKTLKTYLAEATLEFLYSVGAVPYISINWEMLDRTKGYIENIAREEDFIVLKLGTHSIANFEQAGNKFYFHCKFGGKDSACLIPTCAIMAIYNNENGQGTAFNIEMDYRIEQELTEPDVVEEKVQKEEKKVSHLRVIK